MEQKTMKIKRLIEVELIVPTEETKEETEQWMDGIIASGCSMESSDTDHIIRSIRTVQKDEDDQDSFIPNRSLAPILFSNIKILSCPPQSQERLSLVHVSHKT